jgi:probable rRNA maturation factor
MHPVEQHIVVQYAGSRRGIPSPHSLRRYAAAGLGARAVELVIRVVGRAESARLNARYRGKHKPTNVLSFTYHEGRARRIEGDLVLCAPVVAREAREQGKTPAAHWAHLVVHGVLHLRGYDHQNAADAQEMESQERRILKRMGYADPYQEEGARA